MSSICDANNVDMNSLMHIPEMVAERNSTLMGVEWTKMYVHHKAVGVCERYDYFPNG